MGNYVKLLLGRSIAAMTLILLAALPGLPAFGAAPTVPDTPLPADAATSQPITTQLKWNTVFTPPTLTPVSNPKVLIYTAKVRDDITSGTVNAIRATFPDFTPSYTNATDTATLLNLLNDKQVFIVPLQFYATIAQMTSLGTSFGPLLRQFVNSGGLVVATDFRSNNGATQFLASAGLMNATFGGYNQSATMKLVASHALTEDLPTTFSAYYSCYYNSIGDAQALVADAGTNKPVVALKAYGAGNVLLIGWPYILNGAAESRLLANAIKNLSLRPGSGFENYDVYLGTTNPPTTAAITHTYSTQFSPGTLAYSTNYYWKVVAHNLAGDTEGPVWSFRTGPSPMPTAPSQPNPPDAGSWIPKTTQLTWKAGAYATSYAVRFGTTNPPDEVAAAVTQTNYSPGPLANNTTYYWQVTSHNETGEAAGPVWSFTTQSSPGAPKNPDPADDATSVAITTKLLWDSGTPDTTHTIQIAFFTAHADLANEYPHTLAAIRKFAPDFQATDINAEDTPTLAAALVGKNAFVMVEQENWTPSAMTNYGTKAGPVLRQFAQDGGLVVVLDHDPNGGSANFLNSSGLMSVGTTWRLDNIMVTTYGSNPIIQGLPYYFGVAHGAACYNGTDGQAFLWNYSSPYYPVASMKAVGSGNVLLLGWDYDTWTNEQGMVLANAVKMLPAASDESYDVYFGTTNPPTEKLVDRTLLTEFDPDALDYSTTYYWQVVAHNAAGDATGPVWSFRSADPPAPAVPSSPAPANNATNVPRLVTLSWSAGSIPATYSIKFGTTNPPTIQAATDLEQPTFAVPQLENGATYYWQVTATNSTGSTAGPVWSFSTPPLPSIPSNPSPQNGAANVSINPTLSWNVSSAATSYEFYFGTDNPPTTRISTITNTQCSMSALNYETTYYWRIIAINDNGSTSGPVWSFRTVNLPLPTAPSTPTPGNQATLVPVSTGLSWSAGSIPATFSVKLGTTNPPTTQVANGLTQPTFNPAGLSLNTTYYWQVTATNKTGSTDGPVWSFSTPPLPTTPVYTFPENGDTTHQLNVSLWWEPSTAGNTFVKYDVYIGTTNPPTTKIVSDTGSGYCDAWMLYTFDYETTYYWQVVAHNTYGSTNGPVWSFTTEKRPKPGRPSNPSPANLALIVPTTTTLSWSASTNAASYSVKLDTKNPPASQIATGLTEPSFKPATLNAHTTYYWQVTATNSSGSTPGPVWSFTTTPTPTLYNPLPANGTTGVGVTPQLQWNTTTDTVKVLAFTGHVLGGTNSQYQKTLSAIRENFTNFSLTETTSETAAALEPQLVGKQVFFIPNQDNWTETAMGTFGTNAGPVLKKFVQAGGMIMTLDCAPHAHAFWANAGMMNISAASPSVESGLVSVWNGITEGLTPDGFYPITISTYSALGDAQSLLKSGYSYQYSGMAFKRIGAGSVLSTGLSFNTYKKEPGQLIANAIKNHPTATYDVYFGTANPPTTKKVAGTDLTHWSPGTLNYATTYYWRVVAHNGYGDTTGPVWSFRTMNLPLPAAPSNPNPAHKQVFVPTNAKLSWAAPAIPATFSVKFGTTNPPTTQIANGIATSTCSPGTLTGGATYYWQVTATNATGKTVGPVWSFSTPALAHTPVSLGPLDKAKNVPLNTPLRWDTNSTFTLPVQILTWKNMDGRAAYENMLAALRAKYTNFVISETATTDPSTLASQLVGKHVFLMPSHDLWPTSMGTFGANVGTVLKQFVQAGGLVIMCDYSPSSGVVPFLNSAGLMNVTANAAINNSTLRVVDAAHIVNRGVASTFVSSLDTVTYAGVGDAQVLIKQNTTGKPVVAYKPIGAGAVLLLGWNYYQSSSNMVIMLANAIRYLGGAGVGVEHYDVYFGTANPPTTKLSQGNTYDTFCNSPLLQYGKTYYWRVVVHNVYGDKLGPVWSFTATGRTGVESREWLRYQ